MVLLAGHNKRILHTHTSAHTLTHRHSTQISINIYPVTQRHKNRDAAAVGPLKGAQRRRINPVPGSCPVPASTLSTDDVVDVPFQHAWTIADDSEHALASRSHSRSMLSFPTKTLPWRTLLAPHAVWGMPQAGRHSGKRSLSPSLSLTCIHMCLCVCVSSCPASNGVCMRSPRLPSSRAFCARFLSPA